MPTIPYAGLSTCVRQCPIFNPARRQRDSSRLKNLDPVSGRGIFDALIDGLVPGEFVKDHQVVLWRWSFLSST